MGCVQCDQTTLQKILVFFKKYKDKIILFLPHVNRNILYVDGWRASLGSIVQNLVANYPFLVFSTKQFYIGINATH